MTEQNENVVARELSDEELADVAGGLQGPPSEAIRVGDADRASSLRDDWDRRHGQ
jgi:hypothetical protein